MISELPKARTKTAVFGNEPGLTNGQEHLVMINKYIVSFTACVKMSFEWNFNCLLLPVMQ